MSGAVSFLATANEAVNALGTFAFGATGGVVLGDLAFSDFEVPAFITFGGTQQMTVHKLPGGERQVDLLGPDDRNLDWSGTFLGNDPVGRAQQLDQMRTDGAPLPLSWGNFFYTVFIASFEADTRYQQVPYRISCLVSVATPNTMPTNTNSPMQYAQGALY